MQRPTVELSMIVKNGAPTLARCLESVSTFIDRIVIGDTGSTDASIAIAREFGAEVLAVPWEKDFARARNRVLAQARCDWVLVLDADEVMDPLGAALLGPLLAGEETGADEIFAYDVWRWNYVRDAQSRNGEHAPRPNPCVVEAARPYPAYVPSLNTRLFRRHPQIYFEHCVHETVAGRLDALGMRRAEADFVIHHFGLGEDAEEVRKGKNELYRELGLNRLQRNPGDYRASFELGLAELEHGRRPAAALACFEHACALYPQHAPSWLFAGICLIRVGKPREALERLARTQQLGLRTSVLDEALGDAHFHSGDYAEARAAYEQAQANGAISALNIAKLGAAEVHLGLREQGIRRMRAAVESHREFAELYDILAAGALLGGDLPVAAQAAEARLALGQPGAGHFQFAAALQANLGQHAAAERILERGRALFPK